MSFKESERHVQKQIPWHLCKNTVENPKVAISMESQWSRPWNLRKISTGRH